MPSEVPYGTFANYSPRGTSEISLRSRRICGAIKAGKTGQIERAIPFLRRREAEVLQPFLNGDVVLSRRREAHPLLTARFGPQRLLPMFLRIMDSAMKCCR